MILRHSSIHFRDLAFVLFVHMVQHLLEVDPQQRVDRHLLDLLLVLLALSTPRQQSRDQTLPIRELLLHQPIHHHREVRHLVLRKQLMLVLAVLRDRIQAQEVQVAEHLHHLLPALAQRSAQLPSNAAERDERGLRRRVLAQPHEELDGVVGALRVDVLRGDAGELREEVDERVESVLPEREREKIRRG